MTTHKSHKISIYFYILMTIAGCVFACGDFISNDYVKLVVVMAMLCFGLYGIMSNLSSSSETTEESVETH